MADGKARAEKSVFRYRVTVTIDIAASSERVWSLLTDAEGIPRWNSTVSKIDGQIALGQRLSVRVPISPRTFTPKVTMFEPNRRMTWADGAAPMFTGVRTFELQPSGAQTRFTMSETFAGLMLPMISGTLPDFAPVFTQYADDLKREAEIQP